MNAPVPLPSAVRTTCPYCGVGCGVLAKPDGRGDASIIGDPEHPANFGRLCSKGAALGETLGLATRLLHALTRREDGTFTRISWDTALGRVANGLRDVIARHGPNAVAFYLSGQLLTEDYYVANKLMKGFIGSANVDTNSRLCMASSVAGHRRAFGADTVPGTSMISILAAISSSWSGPMPHGVIPFSTSAFSPIARTRRQDGGDRSAPHGDRGRRRSVFADRAGYGYGVV